MPGAQLLSNDSANAGNASGLRPLVALVVVGFAAFELRHFLADGLPIFFDAHSHVSRSWMTARALSAGHYPVWSNDWYAGYRLLEFYSPAYYLVTGALSALTRDVVATTKLVLFVGQIGAVLGFYAYVLRVTVRPLAAGFAAVLLIESVERMQVLGVIGNYPSLFIYLFTPLLLLVPLGLVASSEGTSRAGALRLFAAQSLLLAVLLLSHLSNALVFVPSLLAFEGAWIWQVCRDSRSRGEALLAALVSVPAALFLVAFALVPMALDVNRVLLSSVGSAPPMSLDSLESVLGLAPFAIGLPFARNPGMAWWILAAGGALASLWPAQRRFRPYVVGLCTTLACLFVFGERAALGVGFFLFPLCALVLERAAEIAAARGLPAARVVVFAVAAVLAVVLARGDFARLPRYEPADSLSVYTRLPATRLPSRTLDVTASAIAFDGLYGVSSFSPYVSGRSIPFGGFPQGAPLSHGISMALAGHLASDLGGGAPSLSEESADLLYLFGVEFLVERERTVPKRGRIGPQARVDERPSLPRMSVDASIGQLRGPHIFQLRHASPAIFAPQLSELPERFASAGQPDPKPSLVKMLERARGKDPLGRHVDPTLDLLYRVGRKRDAVSLLPLVRDLKLAREQNTAEHFYVDAELTLGEGLDAAPPSASTLRFEVLSHHETLETVTLEASASAAGFVRLAYSFDPDQSVELDGREVVAVADALGAGVVVAFPAGTHTIEIAAPVSRLRGPLMVASGTCFIGLLVLYFATRRGPPRED